MDNKGKIYTYSIIYSAAEAFKNETPYLIAVVEGESGMRVLARISGWLHEQRVAVGMDVELAGIDKSGNPVYRIIA